MFKWLLLIQLRGGKLSIFLMYTPNHAYLRRIVLVCVNSTIYTESEIAQRIDLYFYGCIFFFDCW